MQIPVTRNRGIIVPAGSIGVDWTHPITADLISVMIPGASPWDPVSNTLLPPRSSAGYVPYYQGGKALTATGASQGAIATAPPSVKVSGNQSIFFLGNIIGNPISQSCVYVGTCYTNSDTSPYYGLALVANSSTSKLSIWSNNSGTAYATDFVAYATGPQDLLMTCVASTQVLTLYKNGVSVSSISGSGWTGTINYTATSQLACGAYPDGGTRAPNVNISAGYIWNRALTSAEAQQLHDDPFCFIVDPSDLVSAMLSPSRYRAAEIITRPDHGVTHLYHPHQRLAKPLIPGNVRIPVTNTRITVQETPFHPGPTATKPLIPGNVANGIRNWSVTVQEAPFHPPPRLGNAVIPGNVASGIGRIVTIQERPDHPGPLKLKPLIPGNVEPPVIIEAITVQEVPFHPGPGARAGIQGPAVASGIRNWSITIQETPFHPGPVAGSAVIPGNVASGIRTWAVTIQEQPDHPGPLATNLVAAIPQASFPSSSESTRQEQPDHPRSFLLSAIIQGDVASGIGRVATTQEQPFHPGPAEWFGVVPGNTPIRLVDWAVTVQERPDHPGPRLGNAAIPGNVASGIGRVSTAQEAPFHPAPSALAGVQGPNVASGIVSTSITRQEAPDFVIRAVLAIGVQGPNVASGIRSLAVTVQEMPFHPGPAVYPPASPPPPIVGIPIGGISTVQEQPFHPGAGAKAGIQGPDVASGVRSWAVTAQEAPSHPGPRVGNAVIPGNVASGVRSWAVTVQERPDHPGPVTLPAVVPGNVASGIRSWAVTVQEQPDHPGPRAAALFIPPGPPIQNVGQAAMLQVTIQEIPFHPGPTFLAGPQPNPPVIPPPIPPTSINPLRARGLIEARPYVDFSVQANRYLIQKTYGSAIGIGDLVVTSAGGYVQVAPNSASVSLGVFVTVESYYDRRMRAVAWGNNGAYPGGASASADIPCFVVDDPLVSFRAQVAGGPWQQWWRGMNIGILAGSNGASTESGQSVLALDGASVAYDATLPFRIVDLALPPDGPQDPTGLNPWIEVRLNLSECLTSTGI